MEEVFEYFKECPEQFEQIKNNHNGNRKIVEICSAILNIYNPQDNIQNVPITQKNNSAMNLLEMGSTNPNSNNTESNVNLLVN